MNRGLIISYFMTMRYRRIILFLLVYFIVNKASSLDRQVSIVFVDIFTNGHARDFKKS
jgi:hypothetical protein